ncbi:hypothetical protein AVEN_230748-1 [Araneus ventricosus]|uniref:Uncharacterized protein n=1 Tax=Araneus ventricosus TaxID=182803 RepID=A0A4Y2A1W7_ARAVE|nr:hypothetical protein AVEN_230748-1 [Araneus ventricosus]
MCAFNISKRREKNKVENSDIAVFAENCVSNEGGEKKKSINESATKLEVLPSTSASASNAIENNSYIIMKNRVCGLPFCPNTKCDECNMCSLDVI